MQKLPPIQIIRASRRSISLQISKDQGLIVRAPFSVPEDIIYGFLEKKTDWIMKHMSRFSLQNEQKSHVIYYQGVPHGYEYNLAQKESIAREQGLFIFSGKIQETKKEQTVITQWYKKQAQIYMTERVLYYAMRFGFHHGAIRITSATTKWGSCSGRDTISFPWRLMMAPTEVIDYVVVHELAHTVHKNHSPHFWGLVESIDPLWKIHRSHLKEEGWKYTLPTME